MTEIIEIVDNEEIRKPKKEKILIENKHCSKCQIKINRKIGQRLICRDCFNSLCVKYYADNIKLTRVKIPRIKKLNEYEHINSKGEKVKLFLKSDYKECKICLENKHYTDYYTLRDTNNRGSPENYYIGTYCKKCTNKKQIKKSLYIREYIVNILDNIENKILTV